ncbi:MAG: DUF4397 domain-containing protein, partial [Myxococcota bacterium]
MVVRLRVIASTVLATVVAAGASAGCNQDCGEGTEEVEGTCRATAPIADAPQIVCGQGTDLQGTTCVPISRTCGEETMLADGQCTALRICGINTSETEGVCRPANTVCNEDTVFNTDTGLCESPSGVECGFGTTPSVDGVECVPDLAVVCGAGTIADGGGLCVPSARVQIVHMAADPDARFVDVWVAGRDGANPVRLLDDFEFRTATPYLDVLPGFYDLAVAPADSAAFSDRFFLVDNAELGAGQSVQVVARGLLTPDDFDTSNGVEALRFTLDLLTNARETDSTLGDGSFEARLLHAATDAPAVDIDALALMDLSYGADTGENYIEISGGRVITFDLNASPDRLRIASYQTSVAGTLPAPAGVPADLSTLIVASGFIDPASNRAGAPFALHAVLANGTVAALDLAARLQLFHNAAGVPRVDVYALAGGVVADDSLLATLDFREATAFATVPSNLPVDLVVALAGEVAPVANPVITVPMVALGAGTANRVVAVGDASAGEGAAAAPTLVVLNNSIEAPMDPEQLAVQVFHGVPDALAIDFFAELVHRGVPEGDPIEFGLSFAEASNPFPLAANDYVITVTANAETQALDRASLLGEDDAGESVLLAASGFVTPENDEPEFALVIVDNEGAVTELDGTARLQLIHNAPDPAAASVDIAVGGVSAVQNLTFREATPFLWVPTEVDLSVVAAGDTMESLTVSVDDVSLDVDSSNLAVVQGLTTETGFSVVGAADVLLRLTVLERVQVAAAMGAVGFNFVHGSTDLGAVDVSLNTDVLALSDLSFGEAVVDAGEVAAAAPITFGINDAPGGDTLFEFELPTMTASMFDGAVVTALA